MRQIAVMALALAMAAGAAAAARHDPYRSYRFVLYMNGRPVAGAANVALPTDQDAVNYRAGGEPIHVRKPPGRDKYEAITLERGVTHDAGFANWASGAGAGPHASLGLKVFGPAGRLQESYSLANCWASGHDALPPLNAKGSDVAIEELELKCERVVLPGRR